jgi:hypothetical protein
MTNFLSFSDLTWPEVAALPRDLPLVIPLGEGYDLERLSEALGKPPQIGLLPALPYGWRNSGLEVNGTLWLETGIREKVAHIREIHEQHNRREERRRAGFGLWGSES